MSWKDKINNGIFSILTGDNQTYTPLWKPQTLDLDFNISDFEYINVEGTFVERKKAKSPRIPLTFYFQGDDCLDLAEKFYQSSKDPKYWIVSHPYYGSIKGQPLSLSRNDENYGIVGFSVDFWESIVSTSPKKNVSIQDSIYIKSVGIQGDSAKIYASKVNPVPADVSNVKVSTEKMSASIGKVAESKTSGAENYSDYNQLKNKAFVSVDNIADDPVSGISSVNQLMSSPSTYPVSMSIRTSLYNTIFNQLKENLGIKPNVASKSYFEATSSNLIASVSNSLVNPIETDYQSRTEVNNAAIFLKTIYEDYLITLESLQEDLNNVNNYFITDGELQNQVQGLVFETISNLFDMAFEAKQERIIYLKEDSNIYLLTHKYIGLDQEDVNINNFRLMNNIKNKKLFNVPKGTKIKYLV